MRTILVATLLLALTGCQTFKGEKEEVPPGLFIRTEKVEVIKKVYVPIDASLTKRDCEWQRNIKPSQSLREVVVRGGCADHYERKLEAIEKIQGTPVK